MERSRPAETSSPPPDTRPLDWTGFLLLVLFSIWSLLALLPLQLFSPVWAHQLVVTLANNAPLLLIGVALLRLAIARAETLFAMGRECLRLVLSAQVCALGADDLANLADLTRQASLPRSDPDMATLPSLG